MTGAAINFDQIAHLTGDRFGVFDVACPACGPERRSPVNQQRKVLRVWRDDESFATFYCGRCEAQGFVRREGRSGSSHPPASTRNLPPANPVHVKSPEQQIEKARWLWQRRQPLAGSLAERYLRNVRGYGGRLPANVGFLPASGGHSACMIAALTGAGGNVQAVHLTKLAADGRKAGTEADKIVIGSPRGAPIALIPVNDGLGLLIAEGIEEALSGYDATGLGAWAAGNAPLLPYLADAVPTYVECVTILVDDDKAGRRRSDALAAKLESRGIEARLFYAARSRAAA